MKHSAFFCSLGIATSLFALSACGKSMPDDSSAATAPSSTTALATQSAASAAMNAFVERTNNSVSMQPVVLNRLAIGVLDSSKSGAMCALDTIDGVTLTSVTNIELGHAFVLGGWVAASNKQAPMQFTLVLKGPIVYGLDAYTGIPRPDVARALSSSMAGTAGFSIKSALSDLSEGTYEVLALIKSQNGNELCETGREFVVSR
jgi:hypothetical protein